MTAERELETAQAAGNLAQVIGQAVAVHLGGMLGELVQRVTAQPECFFCVSRAAATIHAYNVAVTNAQSAGEAVPDAPQPPEVNRSVTRVPCVQMVPGPSGPMPVCCDVPACFGCVLEQQGAGQRGPVSVGLVGVDGRPLTFRRG